MELKKALEKKLCIFKPNAPNTCEFKTVPLRDSFPIMFDMKNTENSFYKLCRL